jgi:hypothetical protein
MTAGWWLAIGSAPLALAGMGVSTWLLEAFVQRPDGGGSLTTLFPGLVYASATIAKVSLGVSAAAVAMWAFGRKQVSPASALSLAVVPLAPVIGTITLLVAERLAAQAGVSMSYIPGVARKGVLAMVACLAVGLVAAVSALRQPPRPAAVLGVAVNAVLLALFSHFRFYQLGFDQDRWAAPE